MSRTKNKLPLSRAITYIVVSVAVCSGVPAFIKKSYQLRNQQISKNPLYFITNIAQTGPVKEAIKTEHLAELLGLSVDKPQNLFAFDLSAGEKRLFQSGVIKQARLSKEPPNTLVVDYVVREPLAYIADYSNLVIDEEGTTFPLTPYFTPKILPSIYLGIKIIPLSYGKLADEKFKIALDILEFFKKLDLKKVTLQKIDVSNIRANTIGKQEIIVVLTEELGGERFARYLRLTPENYIEEIEHYLNLKQMGMSGDLIIDLRLLPNAYLTQLDER